MSEFETESGLISLESNAQKCYIGIVGSALSEPKARVEKCLHGEAYACPVHPDSPNCGRDIPETTPKRVRLHV
jgi:hypothetical protein